MDLEEYECEINAMINQQKEREQDFKYHEHLREKALLEIIDEQDKIINAMAKDMFCYLDNTISNYKKVNSVEELKQYYEKKVSEE